MGETPREIPQRPALTLRLGYARRLRSIAAERLSAMPFGLPSATAFGFVGILNTKAMHLLQSGVSLVMVNDFLGHVDMKSTEVYVQADLEMKRKALSQTNGSEATQAAEPPLRLVCVSRSAFHL